MTIAPPTPQGKQPFKPYAGLLSRARSLDGSIFYAQLGGFGDDKATFQVYVWVVRPGGAVESVPIVDPPNDHALFSIDGGRLVLSGSRNKANGEWEIPGFYAPGAAAGSYVTAPNGFIRLFAEMDFDGEESIDLAARGIPPCRLLNVQLTVSAPAVDRRLHAGGLSEPFAMLTVASQVPWVRNFNTGSVVPRADHTLIIRTTGQTREAHVDVLWWFL